MKKVILTGYEVKLLITVGNSTEGFYTVIKNFLEKNKKLPDKKTAELKASNDEFDDLLLMVNQYKNERLSQKKVKILKALLNKIESLQEEKFFLKGREIRLLLKVKNSGYKFYDEVNDILEEKKMLPNEETEELIVDDIHLEDIVDMVKDYLENDWSSDDENKPTEEEVEELTAIVAKIEFES